MRLTSRQGGSGRPEEGRSPAQAAWQPASAQQQIQAGLQHGGSPQRGAPVGRPRPRPRASPGPRSSISFPLRSAGGRQAASPRGRAPAPGWQGCALGWPRARPRPVRPLTARPRSPPGQAVPGLPSRRREGRRARARRGGGTRGPASRWRGRGLRLGPAGPKEAGWPRGRVVSPNPAVPGPPGGALQA